MWMGRVEKTVFISYRRTNAFMALAVYQRLEQRGYDVFLDYHNINSGDFEQIIITNIRARAHFLVILTPTALERCHEPNDWLRREIEIAIQNQRNIIPLLFEDFDFGHEAIAKHLYGQLALLTKYNALRVPVDYFEEAIARLCDRFLNISIETVLHPVPSSIHDAAQIGQSTARAASPVTRTALEAERQIEHGQVLRGQGKHDAAQIAFERAQVLNPESAVAQYLIGCNYADAGNHGQALQHYNEALKRDPEYAEAYNNRGNAYAELGNLEAAIADFTEAIRLKPDFAYAYNNRGWDYYRNGELDLAIADLERAVEIDPNYARAKLNLERLRGLSDAD
jgi:tetratricopeptide (TPR) repeat protein